MKSTPPTMLFPRLSRRINALVAICLAVAFSGLAQPGHAQEVRTYIVQPGDSAWSIAAQFYGSGDKYPIIYKHNDFVGKPPFLLKPGQVLKLPVLGTGPEAQVGWLKRDVRAKPPRSLDWLEAREQMNLWRLYRVSTGDESAAHIVFEDTSDLKLRENALLVIYGASASAARTGRRDKLEVTLEQGTIQGGLAELDAAATGRRLSVKTPSGQVDILGKLAQVQAEAAASMVSVYEGQAAVTAMGATVEVPEGQGTVVEKGKRPEPARPLPEAPAWAGNAASLALVPVITGRLGTWEAAWTPVATAETYRVELATDEGFKQVLYDAEVGAGVTRLRLADLGPGRYAVRLSTRDKSKLESRPGKARVLEVVEIQPSRAVTIGEGGALEAVGFLRFEIPKELADRVRIARASDPTTPIDDKGVVRLGQAGLHELALVGAEAQGAFSVRVLGVAAALDELPDAPLARELPVTFGLAVTDERSRPAVLPGLMVEDSRGNILRIEESAAGRYTVELPAPADTDRLAIRARWAGGVLLERELPVAPRPVVAAPERASLPFVPHRARRGLPQAHINPVPETRLGLDSRLVDFDPGPGSLALELEGELALGSVGLEAGLVFQDVRLEEKGDTQSRVGDLALGARYSLFATETAAFSPYLRLGVPLGSGEARQLSLEPGFLLRITPVERFFFDFRVALVHANDFADTSASNLGGLFAIAWRPIDALSFNLSAETVAGLDREFFGHIAGVGVGLYLGEVRLGLSFGLGLGDEAKAELGSLFGRLVLDLGFGGSSSSDADAPDSVRAAR